MLIFEAVQQRLPRVINSLSPKYQRLRPLIKPLATLQMSTARLLTRISWMSRVSTQSVTTGVSRNASDGYSQCRRCSIYCLYFTCTSGTASHSSTFLPTPIAITRHSCSTSCVRLQPGIRLYTASRRLSHRAHTPSQARRISGRPRRKSRLCMAWPSRRWRP